MAAPNDPGVVLELAKSAVDALALARLREPAAYVTHTKAGTIGEATYQVQWSRPTLTFPSDVPDAVRLGLLVEGGVRLPNERILSLSTFMTTTVVPHLTQDETGQYARLALAESTLSEIRFTYAGVDLPPEPVRPALGLPDDATLATLRANLRGEIDQFLATLPDLPLTPRISSTQTAQVHIVPETRGAALVLAMRSTADGFALPPLVVSERDNAAILVNSGIFAAAFDSVVAPHVATLLPDSMRLMVLRGTCAQDRLWFAAEVRVTVDDVAEALITATIEAEPTLAAGRWHLNFDRVVAEGGVGDELAAQTLGEVLAAEGFRARLSELTQTAMQQVIVPIFGIATSDFAWQWAMPQTTSPAFITFAPTEVRITEGVVALIGALPPPQFTGDFDDVPEFDLHIPNAPVVLDGGHTKQVTVSATKIQHMTPPYDYAWWQGTTNTLLLEHGPTLDVIIRMAEDDPHDTLPRHLKTRELPVGVASVRAALIDSLGRVTNAALIIDLEELSKVPADRYATIGGFALSGPRSPTVATQQILTGMQTRLGTAYQPTGTQVQARSSLLGMVAGALAVFAVVALIATFLLTHSLAASGPTAQATLTPTTTTPPVTLTAHNPTPSPVQSVTGTISPGPSATPQPFGRFGVAPTSLQFICTAGTTTPQTLTLSNTGTASVDWTTRFFGMVGASTTMQLWGSAVPASGTLLPGASIPVEIRPINSFCSTSTTGSFIVQFAAPSVVPLNISATHT